MLSEKCMPLKVTALLFIGQNLPYRFIRKTLLLLLGLANGAPLQPSSASTRRRATMYQVTIRGQVPETMKSIKAWARRLVSRSSPIHLAGASQSQAPFCDHLVVESCVAKVHKSRQPQNSVLSWSSVRFRCCYAPFHRFCSWLEDKEQVA